MALGLYLSIHVLVLAPSCTSDELPAPVVAAACDTLVATYDTNVKPIIDATCAYSACHSSSSTTGAPGNFTSYSGLAVYLSTGSFRARVFDQESSSLLIMPPNNLSIYPQTEKVEFTDEEWLILECWLDAGHPEN